MPYGSVGLTVRTQAPSTGPTGHGRLTKHPLARSGRLLPGASGGPSPGLLDHQSPPTWAYVDIAH
jgi:hypothetical protein